MQFIDFVIGMQVYGGRTLDGCGEKRSIPMMMMLTMTMIMICDKWQPWNYDFGG